MGAKPTYSKDLVDEIVARLEKGEPLLHICRDEHMPTARTVYEWMRDDGDIGSRIAHAREIGYDQIATGTLDIADQEPTRDDNGRVDPGFVAWQKNRIWTRQQLLAKWAPKKYGDRVTTEVTGADGGALKVEDSTPNDAARKIALALSLGLRAKANSNSTDKE